LCFIDSRWQHDECCGYSSGILGRSSTVGRADIALRARDEGGDDGEGCGGQLPDDAALAGGGNNCGVPLEQDAGNSLLPRVNSNEALGVGCESGGGLASLRCAMPR
jgi:hypothetical protein